MLSVIEVTCPHCGARGTIMVPPVGSVLIGPCPLCKEMVVLFAGRVMALDKDIMLGDDSGAKRDHLMDVLTEYIRERVDEIFASGDAVALSVHEDEYEDEILGEDAAGPGEELPRGKHLDIHPTIDSSSLLGPISRQEVDDFLRIDVPLLAKDEYFRVFFGRDK